MGITGLIPFLKPASRPVNIKEYSGCTVAIDTYCWLHKGAIGCAEKLVRGIETDIYVNYCVKYIEMLQSHRVKPILVLDGRHLPAKAETEKSRRQRRENNKKKAADLLKQDRPDEARNVMKACIDITPQMAFSLIQRCRKIGVDCIVAPYEADAQLAYLSISGIAHVVVTEDSDLLLFGCERVLFKMDLIGNGLLVEQSKLPLAMKVHPDRFSMDKFRHMCILSGCDYLPSLPGIGLAKACKFIKRTAETNMSRALTKLGAHLNMSHLTVSREYVDKFLTADFMFKHQPVFDPISRKLVPLTPIPEGAKPSQLDEMSDDIAFQLALGNLNPLTLEKFDGWNPNGSSRETSVGPRSIWSLSYSKPKPILPLDRRKVETETTQGKIIVLDEILPALPTKKSVEVEVQELKNLFGKRTTKDATFDRDTGYSSAPLSENGDEDVEKMNITSVEDDILDNLDLDDDEANEPSKSPVLVGHKFVEHSPRNVFSQSKHKSSEGLFRKKLRTTEIDEENIVCSRYFSSSQDSNSENRPVTSTKGPKIGQLTDDEFNFEIDRIINLEEPDPKIDNRLRTPFTEPIDKSSQMTAEESPLTRVTRLSKGLDEAKEDRPSLLARLDKMSQILSKTTSPTKSVTSTSSSSSFKWAKKKLSTSGQKSFLPYLLPGSTTPRKSLTSSKPSTSKSNTKRPSLTNNKKEANQGSLLENFGFKPKAKMTL